jgi:hypothetical protein
LVPPDQRAVTDDERASPTNHARSPADPNVPGMHGRRPPVSSAPSRR